jgi:hypothetical protein
MSVIFRHDHPIERVSTKVFFKHDVCLGDILYDLRICNYKFFDVSHYKLVL